MTRQVSECSSYNSQINTTDLCNQNNQCKWYPNATQPLSQSPFRYLVMLSKGLASGAQNASSLYDDFRLKCQMQCELESSCRAYDFTFYSMDVCAEAIEKLP